MQKNILLGCIVTAIHCFSLYTEPNRWDNVEQSKQRMRMWELEREAKHPMHRFHPKMINYWILTGEVKPTASIPLPADSLKEQVKYVRSTLVSHGKPCKEPATPSVSQTDQQTIAHALHSLYYQAQQETTRWKRLQKYFALACLVHTNKNPINPNQKAIQNILRKKNNDTSMAKKLHTYASYHLQVWKTYLYIKK